MEPVMGDSDARTQRPGAAGMTKSAARCREHGEDFREDTLRAAVRRHVRRCPVRIRAAKQLEAEYKDVDSLEDLAAAHGIGTSTVWRLLHEIGAETKKIGRPTAKGAR
jgi:hypothetical protein